MILAGIISKLQSQSAQETGAQKETSGLIRSLIEKMGLLQEATENDTDSREKESRDEKRRSGGRNPIAGITMGFKKFRAALDKVTAGVGNFGKGLKNALSGVIETFSFSNLKNVLLSPLKLVQPALLLGLGSALLGTNVFGGGLLAAGAVTGNPMLILAGALTLLVGNLKTIIPFIKNLADPEFRQETFDKIQAKFDPDAPGNIWRLMGEKLPGFIYSVLGGAFSRLREIIGGALGVGGLVSTGLAGLATYGLARRIPLVGGLLPGISGIASGGLRAGRVAATAATGMVAARAQSRAFRSAAARGLTPAQIASGFGGREAMAATQRAAPAASRLGRFAGTAVRGLGKLAIPVTATFAAFDAYKGFVADENASVLQKTGNALSSIANGLTFGLVGKSATEIEADAAENAEQLAGNVISEQQQYLQTNPLPVEIVNGGNTNVISSNSYSNSNQSTTTVNMPQIVPNNPLYTSLF